ncbi:TetR/AcrR family transcriptional regulator [Kineosporia succinea]|uniref:AcrR family transcriptional regulator n=1 Tax=Kineosporia succinea TaxID=84632 RepID=A0ABT9PC89_9ACTN|nr:TetR/AcrR family transcriptional regulator [Kineosporia succinea]MDP9830323.1 AcrR family transcriptional regulator [Kineosporia succinea]
MSPKVSQEHLDARRQQIVDAARDQFATRGFARTSMADIVAGSGLSNGAIYRYFTSKDDIVVAVCAQGSQALPETLTAASVATFLEHVRTQARDTDHGRLVVQIYAEAAVSPALAAVVQGQLADLRARVAELVPPQRKEAAGAIAEAFVSLCAGYSQQVVLRGDVDPAPYVTALMAVIEG